MKNLTNLRANLLHGICVVATFFLVASCEQNKTNDSKDVAERENVDRLTGNDSIVVIENEHAAIFLVEAAEMELEKITLGKLAQEKGNSTHVRELGKMMEEDHTKSFNELKALAQSKSVSIPTTITEDTQDTRDDLAEKDGNDFGKAYSDRMVEHHEDAIDLYERASTESEDPDVRAWAGKKLPDLRTHLSHAEECKEKCDNMDS